MELTHVKFGLAYYGMCSARRITLKSLLKTDTNFGEFWRIQKIANLSACKKTNEVQNPRRILHTAL